MAGRTLLEIALSRLRDQGVREAIVNVHHFADMVVEYLEANHNFGMHIEVSREDVLLDTGGGLKKAAYFFLRDGGEAPFILHNVDVISTFDLGRMARFHHDCGALATLAVARRETSRYLVFDEQMRLRGRWPEPKSEHPPASDVAGPEKEKLAFAGIHIVSPRLFGMLNEEGAFSIITAYLRLAAGGEGDGKIFGFRDDRAYWRDLGTPESIARAAADLEEGRAVY
jgi:NDP-sugar pyrophosphorylase family protein